MIPSFNIHIRLVGTLIKAAGITPGPEVGGSGAGKVIAPYPAGAQVMVFY